MKTAFRELRKLGWQHSEVFRFGKLFEYRRRLGAINLEREERLFLRKAEAALAEQRVDQSVLNQPVGGGPRSKDRLPQAAVVSSGRAQILGTDRSESDCFVALDFETADYGRDSACSIALVRVEEQKIVHRFHQLIRPPRKEFYFTPVHGITWQQVEKAPSFGELWPEIQQCLEGAGFIAAHNSAFDSSVMGACCKQAGVAAPSQPYLCTVQLARRSWNVYPTKLPDVCRHLNLSLKHHDALSDAEACANIVLAAARDRSGVG